MKFAIRLMILVAFCCCPIDSLGLVWCCGRRRRRRRCRCFCRRCCRRWSRRCYRRHHASAAHDDSIPTQCCLSTSLRPHDTSASQPASQPARDSAPPRTHFYRNLASWLAGWRCSGMMLLASGRPSVIIELCYAICTMRALCAGAHARTHTHSSSCVQSTSIKCKNFRWSACNASGRLLCVRASVSGDSCSR